MLALKKSYFIVLAGQNVSLFAQAQGRHDVIYEEYRRAQAQLEKVEAYSAKIAEEMDKLNAMETDENRE